MGERQRMYLFERAYVDYAARIRRFLSGLLARCGDIWQWFWSGLGSRLIEALLRLCVVVAALGLAITYVRYENAHGRGFSVSMAGVFAVIVFCAAMVLWGWKAVVHWLARLVSGASAAGVVMVLALIAAIVASACFSVYLLVLSILTALSFLIFLPLRGAQEIWLLYRHIGYHCPYGDCPAKGLPIHLCTCGHEYSDLLPGFYGLRYHTCRHVDGTQVQLPTMDLLGRNKLARLCKGCRRPLVHSAIGESAEWPIALVGGPSAGKTVMVVQTISELTQYFARLKGSVLLGGRDGEYEALRAQLDRGQLLAKTAGGVSEAWGVAVRAPKNPRYPTGLRSLLYLFDNPGEIFGSMQQLGQMHAIQHLKGIVLIVDPFSLPAAPRDADPELKPSQTPLLTVVGNLIRAVEQYLKTGRGEKCVVPLAVVLTKADALPVSEYSYLADLLPGDGRPSEKLDERCRAAIRRLGAGPSLDALALNFSNVRYFAASALGRMPDRSGKPFQGIGVLEPFIWMLDQAVGIDGRRTTDRAHAHQAN